jgi:cytochrome c oxidase subunit 2
MRALRAALLFAAVFLPGLALQAAEGETAYAGCIACHGARGEGKRALHAPALAGQHAAYTARQLRNYRKGIRGSDPRDTYGVQMRGMAMSLRDDAAIDAVAAWLAGLPPPAGAGEIPGDPKNGNDIYQGKCGACHGLTAAGNPALDAPRLAGLDTGYLRRQFLAFREGRRGAHADDRLGKQMAMMAKTIDPGQELDDVLAYIHAQSLPGAQAPR